MGGIEHNWQGKWMIGKEVTPVDGKDNDSLGLEEWNTTGRVSE